MRLTVGLLCLSWIRLVCAEGENWPDFRGPSQQGIVNSIKIPLRWSETENIVWKTAIPGQGWSSPVLEDGRLWMTTATVDGHSRRVVRVDPQNGAILIDRELYQVEVPENKNDLNSFASPSPTIRDGRVYVTFGAVGTACLDAESGEVIWKNDELKINHSMGAGSSPVLFEDVLILHCDGVDQQYVAGLDIHDGTIRWKTNRSVKINKVDDQKKAYGTPLIVDVDGQPQAICIGAQAIYAYDPRTGNELWQARFDGYSNAPRPVVGNGMVFFSTGYDKASLLAYRLGGTGDVTESHLAWSYGKNVPQMPSPIWREDRVYMVSESGIVTCLNALTGEDLWRERIGGDFSASPIWTNGLLYFCDRSGTTTVLKAADTYEVVAVNELENGCMASPAVVGDALFLRTKTHLYRIESR